MYLLIFYPPIKRSEVKSTLLYLLRHGPTAAPKGCFVGSTDVSLSGQGLARLKGLTDHLQPVERWYCSPMLRTRQTFARLRQAEGLLNDPVYDQRLREIDFGRWEMQTFAEIAATDPEQLESWSQYVDFAFPAGEPVSDFISRTEEMLSLFSAAESSNIGVVTHGGIIRTMICLALGLSVQNYLLFEVQPASLTLLELFSQGGILRGLNI
ncbi:MAG: hypothetical protein D3923_02210 [Candidatus Electrothrix sp. AR3]|nr:hypothetical protein [Candidatus Electrothrix sp. AR3]